MGGAFGKDKKQA